MSHRFTVLMGLIALCGCSQPGVVGELELGMSVDATRAELKEVGAVEVPFNVENAAETDEVQNLWRIDRPKMALATKFESGELVGMFLWRWKEAPASPEQLQGRETVSSISIFPKTDGIEATVVPEP